MSTCKTCARENCTLVPLTGGRGCNFYERANRSNKYNARIVKLDGHTFHSQAEADEYLRLKDREQRGEIVNLRVAPVYELVPKWVDDWGNVYPREVYQADFECRVPVAGAPDGWTIETVEVKGKDLRLGRLKRRVAIEKLGLDVRVVWVGRGRR